MVAQPCRAFDPSPIPELDDLAIKVFLAVHCQLAFAPRLEVPRVVVAARRVKDRSALVWTDLPLPDLSTMAPIFSWKVSLSAS